MKTNNKAICIFGFFLFILSCSFNNEVYNLQVEHFIKPYSNIYDFNPLHIGFWYDDWSDEMLHQYTDYYLELQFKNNTSDHKLPDINILEFSLRDINLKKIKENNILLTTDDSFYLFEEGRYGRITSVPDFTLIYDEGTSCLKFQIILMKSYKKSFLNKHKPFYVEINYNISYSDTLYVKHVLMPLQDNNFYKW